MNSNANDEIVQGLLNWVKLYQKYGGYNICRTLLFYNFNSIAIYDINDIGSTLAYEMISRCHFNVKYLFDDARDISVAGLKARPLDSFQKIDNIDAIIICSKTDEEIEIATERIKSKTNAQIKTFGWFLSRGNHYALTIRPTVQLAYYLRQLGVDFYFVATASLTTVKNLSEREKKLKDNLIWGYQQLLPLLNKKELKAITQPALHGKISFEEFLGGIAKIASKIGLAYKNGNPVYQDMQTKYINIVNGNRFTTDTPQKYENKVFFYGDSTALSANTADSETIPSHFQRLLNNKFGDKYLVENYGTPILKGYIFEKMLDTDFKPGDMVFCVCSYDVQFDLPQVCKEAGIDYLNTNFLFDRPNSFGEVFLDMEHMGPFGNEIIANAIFDIAINHGEKRELNPDFDISAIYEELSNRKSKKNNEIEQSREFKNYIEHLASIKKDINGTVGSIVVNCNPFTLGHKFLIEHAASQVDLLYVFVVEEDRSFFPFKDRLELVKNGTAHIENICVLPSGNFIISNLTFPDYFNKGKSKNILVDVSSDIDLFADHIARVLGITKRFVGTEPDCAVTRQYNDYMREQLPSKGIDFIELERKEFNNCPISASRVRELLEIHDFDEISKLVPKTTLDYLNSMGRDL